VDVFDCLVSFLPKFHLNSSVKESQPGVKVPLLGLRIVQIDRVGGWVLLLDDQVKVIPQLVTQLSELCFPLILEAELECLGSNCVIKPLNSDICPEKLQALTVRFPEKLDPRHQDGPVTPFLSSFSRHS